MTGVPILMYHEVAPAGAHAAPRGWLHPSYRVTPELFVEHLATIRAMGFEAMTLAAIASALRARRSLAKVVCISFDDGYEGNFTHAFPALRTCGWPGTFFVATARIGEPGMMSWPQLTQMAQAGMEIESHTHSHPLLSTLTREATNLELRSSRAEIEKHTGHRARFISLPNGDSNRWYLELAHAAGYEGGCGSQFGLNDSRSNPFVLRRMAIRDQTSSADLRSLLTGSGRLYWRALLKGRAKGTVSRIVGKRLYHWVYRNFAPQRGQ